MWRSQTGMGADRPLSLALKATPERRETGLAAARGSAQLLLPRILSETRLPLFGMQLIPRTFHLPGGNHSLQPAQLHVRHR